MARCLVVLLVLVLLLAGCSATTAEPPAPTQDSQQTGKPQLESLYIPNSAMEQATDGAVRAFRLDAGNYYGCAMLADQLLLLHEKDGEGYFSLYRGENLEEIRIADLGQGVIPDVSKLQINGQGIGYFDSKNKDVVFLNPEFSETGRMHLPETLQGSAWLTPDWKQVYYCTDSGIYVMDLQNGIARLLREQTETAQEITGGFGNGEVIRCEMRISEKETKVLLIDGKTGAEIKSGAYLSNLITQGEHYYLPHLDRGVMFLRFGTVEDHRVLWPAEMDAEAEIVFSENVIVTVQSSEENISFACYDLGNGERGAAITLEGMKRIWGITGDGQGGIWFYGENADGQCLYRWEFAKNATEDTTVYTAPYYTPEQADEETLARLIAQAKTLGQKYGVEILLWKNASATEPDNQTFTAEHLTQLYTHYLPKLDAALSVFPQGFFTKTVDQKLKIALLREITGDPAKGTLAQTECVQFWNQRMPVVAITMGEDFEQNLYHGLYLYMETRLLSKSNALYEWYRINPSDFVYDDDYIQNLKRVDTTYIEGEKPYFIDLFSMSFAREDRATIFEYACQEGNEEYFKTPVLQEKLKRICKGIREAYGLKKVTTEFLWEQYLA
jgi:hypothetical protein